MFLKKYQFNCINRSHRINSTNNININTNSSKSHIYQAIKQQINCIRLNQLIVTLIFSMFCMGILSGCAMFTPQGSSAEVSITSVEYLNPNVNGEASPIVVTLYQLESPYNFKQANYHALATNSAKVLAGNLIDKTNIEIRPSEKKKISLPLSPNTQYIGIVAAYRDIENATWHSSVKVDTTKGKRNYIHVNLESRALIANNKETKNKLWGIF